MDNNRNERDELPVQLASRSVSHVPAPPLVLVGVDVQNGSLASVFALHRCPHENDRFAGLGDFLRLLTDVGYQPANHPSTYNLIETCRAHLAEAQQFGRASPYLKFMPVLWSFLGLTLTALYADYLAALGHPDLGRLVWERSGLLEAAPSLLGAAVELTKAVPLLEVDTEGLFVPPPEAPPAGEEEP